MQTVTVMLIVTPSQTPETKLQFYIKIIWIASSFRAWSKPSLLIQVSNPDQVGTERKKPIFEVVVNTRDRGRRGQSFGLYSIRGRKIEVIKCGWYGYLRTPLDPIIPKWPNILKSDIVLAVSRSLHVNRYWLVIREWLRQDFKSSLHIL